MRKYKYLSVLISIVLLFCSCQLACAGEESVFIVSPADGTTVNADTDSFEISLPAEKSAVKVIFNLDGNVIYNGDAVESVDLGTALTLGTHKLEVSAIFDDGTGEKVSSEFDVAILPFESSVDFEEFADLADDTDGMTSTEAQEALGCFNGFSGKIDSKGAKVYIEADEANNHYMTLRSTEASTMTCHESYFHVWAATAADGSHPAVSSGKLVLEFDAYLRQNWTTRVIAVPFNSSGKDWDSNNMLVDQNAGGIVVGEKSYVSLKGAYNWYHFNITYDLDKQVYYGTVSDGDFAKPDNERIGEVTIAETNLPTPASGLNNVVHYRIGVGLNKSSEYRIDNIKISTVGSYKGADEIYYNSPSAGADFVSAANTDVPRDITSLALDVEKTLEPSTVTADNITVVAAGKNMDITEVSYDEATGRIILSLDNPDGISGNGDSFVRLSGNICFKGGSPVGTDAVNPFTLTAEGFTIDGVDFRCGTSYLFSSSQLKAGDSITADITLSNADTLDKTLLAVLVVKKDTQIMTMTPLDITVPGKACGYTVSVKSPEIDYGTGAKASLIFVDSMADVNYIGSYYLI